MSVLEKRRAESKAQYVTTAYEIYAAVIEFLARLSSRYSRLMASHVADLAGQVQAHTEQANAIYPSGEQRMSMRREHLMQARASLMALDAALTLAYTVLRRNPQGAFRDSKGKALDSSKALTKLEHLAADVGQLIDRENALLKGIIKVTK